MPLHRIPSFQNLLDATENAAANGGRADSHARANDARAPEVLDIAQAECSLRNWIDQGPQDEKAAREEAMATTLSALSGRTPERLLVGLNKDLDLGSQMTWMKFADLPGLSEAHVKEAGQRVLAMDGSPAMIDFIAGHDSWKDAVRRHQPAELAQIDDLTRSELECASGLPDGQYLARASEIANNRLALIDGLSKRQASTFVKGKWP